MHSFTTSPFNGLLGMPRGTELNEEERAVIDALHNEGKSCRSIGLVLNRDYSGIAKYLKRRNEDKKERLGAHRNLDDAQVRLLYRAAFNKAISAQRLKTELEINVSARTVLRYPNQNPNFE